MDIRFLSFVEYVSDLAKEYENVTILEEQQAIQMVVPLNNSKHKKIVYDFVFQSECVDIMQIIAFYAPIRNISRKLLLMINQFNANSYSSLYVLHKGKDRTYLRVLKSVATMCGNKERNEKILTEFIDFQEEISANLSVLKTFLV